MYISSRCTVEINATANNTIYRQCHM